MSTKGLTALQHYQEAETLFQMIDHLWPIHKRDLFVHLEKAYEGIDKFPEKRSDLFYMAGRSVYYRRNKEKVQESAGFFALSYHTQLVSLGIFNKNQLPSTKGFSLTAVSTVFDEDVSLVFKSLNCSLIWPQLSSMSNIDSTELFLLAQKVFWLGRSLQHAFVESHQQDKKELFNSINELVTNILTRVGTKDALWMRDAVVPFATSMFLYRLNNPKGTLEGAFAALNRVKEAFGREGPTVRCFEMEAELHNQEATKYRYMLSGGGRSKEEIQELFKKQAMELYEAVKAAVSRENLDPFLRCQHIANMTRVVMDCREEKVTLPEVLSNKRLRGPLDFVLSFMKDSKYTHHYFVSFLCAIIRFEIGCNDLERAMEHLIQALELCSTKFSEECDADDRNNLIEMRENLLRALGDTGMQDGDRAFSYLCADARFEMWCGNKEKALEQVETAKRLFVDNIKPDKTLAKGHIKSSDNKKQAKVEVKAAQEILKSRQEALAALEKEIST